MKPHKKIKLNYRNCINYRNWIKISKEGCKIQLCIYSIFLQGSKCMNAVTHVGAVTAEITTHPQAVKSLL